MVVYRQLEQRPGASSFCDVSEVVSCGNVYRSPYATVRGIPEALLGSLWFAATLLIAAGSAWGPAPFREDSPVYALGWAAIGLGVSFYLAYISFAVLRTVCLMCVATYVAVAGVFVAAAIGTAGRRKVGHRQPAGGLKALFASPTASVSLAVVVIAASVAVAFYPRVDGALEPPRSVSDAGGAGGDTQASGGTAAAGRQSEFERFWNSQPRVRVPVAADGAAVLVVKFTDHQCPACAETHALYTPVLARYAQLYPGAVRYVVEDYPLETECNPELARSMHPAACEAAVAVRLARARGRDAQLDDWLYSNWAGLTPVSVRQAAREVGLVPDYDARYAAVLDQVRGDTALARLLGVHGTPTFFINGVRLDRPVPVEYFDMALQLELRRAGRQGPVTASRQR